MKVETKKNLYLTKAEVKTISQFYDILGNDNNLTLADVWQILIAIRNNNTAYAEEYYGYDIKIID